VSEVATIKSMDVVLPVRTTEGTTDLRLRVVSKPDRMVAKLLQRLGLQLPARWGVRVTLSSARNG
jgi:hypothetical protein